jgi:hypothetical protein
MIEERIILCFASGYDAPPTSKHHIMHLLARRNTILWVNYHASRRPSMDGRDLRYLTGRLRGVFRGLSNPRDNLYVLTPLVIPLPGNHFIRKINRLLLTHRIRRTLTRLGDRALQIWSFSPDISYLLDRFSPERVVYYCVDNFASFSGYDRAQVLHDEADLCRRADLVITTSRALQEAKEALNQRTIFVPHGVDYDHFVRAVQEPLPSPHDIAAIPHPRIGFFGLIRDWVDLDLVAAITRRRRKWQFVFLGDSAVDLSSMGSLDNVHFLGAKPYQALPAYCRQMDAAMIPFKINDLTLAVNPIKLREYLAAGLGVVSTPLPEVQTYKDLVEIADTPDTFESAIERVLRSGADARDRRVQAMRSETWGEKLSLICQQLQKAPIAEM